MIANILIGVLLSIINGDQTDFISGRVIGDNTSIVFDTIDYCEMEKKGLLLILDFPQAFNTIEWSFINKTLKPFNFG